MPKRWIFPFRPEPASRLEQPPDNPRFYKPKRKKKKRRKE